MNWTREKDGEPKDNRRDCKKEANAIWQEQIERVAEEG